MVTVVVVTFGMNFCIHTVGFLCLMKRHNGHTDRWMDRLMDRWTDRPSYRDARMHLKRRYAPHIIWRKICFWWNNLNGAQTISCENRKFHKRKCTAMCFDYLYFLKYALMVTYKNKAKYTSISRRSSKGQGRGGEVPYKWQHLFHVIGQGQ